MFIFHLTPKHTKYMTCMQASNGRVRNAAQNARYVSGIFANEEDSSNNVENLNRMPLLYTHVSTGFNLAPYRHQESELWQGKQ